jgi:hypothetical protein
MISSFLVAAAVVEVIIAPLKVDRVVNPEATASAAVVARLPTLVAVEAVLASLMEIIITEEVRERTATPPLLITAATGVTVVLPVLVVRVVLTQATLVLMVLLAAAAAVAVIARPAVVPVVLAPMAAAAVAVPMADMATLEVLVVQREPTAMSFSLIPMMQCV